MLRQAYLLPSPPAAPKPSAPANFLPRVQCPLQGQQSNTHIHNWDAKPGLEKGQCRRVTAVTPDSLAVPATPDSYLRVHIKHSYLRGAPRGREDKFPAAMSSRQTAKACALHNTQQSFAGKNLRPCSCMQIRGTPHLKLKATWDHFFLLLGKLQEVQSCLLTQDQLRRQ